MRSLIFAVIAIAPLACTPSSIPDGGSAGDSGPHEGSAAADAGVHDAGAGRDAGALADVGAPPADDAGAPDAGWSCPMPALAAPAGDAGRPACALDDISGVTGVFRGTWEGEVFGEFWFGPFEQWASGEMSFEIYCGDDKLLVDGTIEGHAYQHPDAGPEEPGHPFAGAIYGEYDVESRVISMVVNPATLTIGPFSGTFTVVMSGERQNSAFEQGAWCGVTIEPPGGQGEGTWRADLVAD